MVAVVCTVKSGKTKPVSVKIAPTTESGAIGIIVPIPTRPNGPTKSS